MLGQGTSLFGNYTPDVEPRRPTVIGDSCVTFNSGNKTAESDGMGMAKAYSERRSKWEGKTLPIVILTKDAARQEQILTMLTTFIASISLSCKPEDFTGHLVFIFSPNDVKKGNKEIHDYMLDVPRKIRDLLRRFPVGTVTILTPGSSANFGFTPEHNFEKLAEYYTEIFVDSGHPVFNPSFLYGTMEPNFWKSAVRENRVHLQNEDGSYKYKFDRDMHFLDCSQNYDIMTAMITRLCCITQMFGNLCDVARGTELPFMITTPSSDRKRPADVLRPSFFSSGSGRGARSVTVGDHVLSSGAKALAPMGKELSDIPEASPEEVLACNLRFLRCPVYGDMMVANCGRTASGGRLPNPRG